jgi:hypothetical protein
VLARILVSASSVIMILLGSIHLLYTFSGNRLAPRDPGVQAAMSATQMMLTSETTVWRAWVGFNASHSMCAMFFGLVFGFLAAAHPDLLFRSTYLQLLGLAVLAGFVVLAKLYWFSVPLVGVSIAFGCFLAGLVVARLHY